MQLPLKWTGQHVDSHIVNFCSKYYPRNIPGKLRESTGTLKELDHCYRLPEIRSKALIPLSSCDHNFPHFIYFTAKTGVADGIT